MARTKITGVILLPTQTCTITREIPISIKFESPQMGNRRPKPMKNEGLI